MKHISLLLTNAAHDLIGPSDRIREACDALQELTGAEREFIPAILLAIAPETFDGVDPDLISEYRRCCLNCVKENDGIPAPQGTQPPEQMVLDFI